MRCRKLLNSTTYGRIMAEREGFEPPCRLPGKTLSRRPRYDHFGTSPKLDLLRPALASAARRVVRAAAGEELLYDRAALAREHTACRRHPVVQRRMLVRAHR